MKSITIWLSKKVPLRHAAESPALVQAKCAGSQSCQPLGGVRGQFSSFDKFLQVCVHQRTVTTYSRIRAARNFPFASRCVA